MRASLLPPCQAGALSDKIFFGTAAALFTVSVATTTYFFISMPSGARMSVPNPTPFGSVLVFIGMWLAMNGVMMLPALMPALISYRCADTHRRAGSLGWRTLLVALGYFAVWAAMGFVAFAAIASCHAMALSRPLIARAAPLASAGVILAAGLYQFTSWKSHNLACCRVPGRIDCVPPCNSIAAWLHGLHLGMRCVCCCGLLMAVMLAKGMMDLRVMVIVTAAIALERLAPTDKRIARIIGGLTLAAGLYLTLQALAGVFAVSGVGLVRSAFSR